jgi:NTE family protein
MLGSSGRAFIVEWSGRWKNMVEIENRVRSMKRFGMALGGGGLKGMAHIGVLQILWDNGLKPQYISGTSAGSIIATLYACGTSPYKMQAIVSHLSPADYLDYNIMGTLKYLISLVWPTYQAPLEGIILGDKLERLVYALTDGKKLSEAEIPLAIISCDINSGRKVIFTNQEMEFERSDVVVIKDALLSEAVRSSVSIPVTFKPKNFAGLKMVDGGLKEIVPSSMAKRMGADYILSVNLGQEMYDSQVKGIPQIISRTLSILTYETSEMEEEIYSDMTIFPEIQGTRLDDTEAIEKIIRAGRRAMKEKLAQLKRELGA